jgi:hypothetical protein
VEVREIAGAAQAAKAASLVPALFEAVVDRDQVLVQTVPAFICRLTRRARSTLRVNTPAAKPNSVALALDGWRPSRRRRLECGDRPEDFLLDDRFLEVLDLDQAAPVESARGSVTGLPRTITLA